MEVAKDLTAGTLAGVAQLLVGHPFDTIKVKLQSAPGAYSGAIDAVRRTVSAEGAKGLYAGMGAPLATVAVFNAVLFSARGQMEAALRRTPGESLSVAQQAVAGAGAGVAVSLVACPTELVKCRLQAQSALLAAGGGTAAVTAYSGPMDVARAVLRNEGGALGLYKGLFPTLLREVPGNATMFGVYEAMKRALAGPGGDVAALGQGQLLVAGGTAGAAFWAAVYPADVVKSVIQVDDAARPKYHGSMHALRTIFAADGVKGLYRGFGPAMARSIPANAACFLAYEQVRSRL